MFSMSLNKISKIFNQQYDKNFCFEKSFIMIVAYFSEQAKLRRHNLND